MLIYEKRSKKNSNIEPKDRQFYEKELSYNGRNRYLAISKVHKDARELCRYSEKSW
jgi:hypothetical protein